MNVTQYREIVDCSEKYSQVQGKDLAPETLAMLNKVITIIKLGMSRDGHNTKHYRQSNEHIADILEYYDAYLSTQLQ